jgi:hypothetical protein
MTEDKDKIALFSVETSFNIRSRGIVAVGEFIKGKPSFGAKANVVVNSKTTPVTVCGISWGTPNEEGSQKVGLTLCFADEDYKKLVEQNRLEEQIISLEHSDP